MNVIKWFATSFGLAFGAALGIAASAAPGDQIYVAGGAEVAITGPQAACFADCAIAAGAWDGARADMRRTCAFRKDDGTFGALTVGLKTAAPGNLPVSAGPVQVVGVVE